MIQLAKAADSAESDVIMNFEPSSMQKAREQDYDSLDGTSQSWGSRPRNRLILGVIAGVIVVGALLVYRMQPAAKAAAPAPALSTVTVISAARTPINRVVTATGSLAARREMPVGAVGEGGLVTRVLVEPGDWVRAGQVLATIERSVQAAQNSASAAQISVAEANARIAQSELERAQALVSRGFISKADVDRKQATRDAAAAQVNVARAQLRQSTALSGRLDIRAPAAGLVLTRTVEAGQVVGAGTGVLFRIARGGEIEMKALLAESDIAQLKTGDRADVTPVGSKQSFAGQVWQIAPVIDPQSRQGTARIALPYNTALRPGGFATASLSFGTIDAPLLPDSAVLSSDTGSYVYIIDKDNKVVKRPVTVADVSEAGVAIGAGLDGSEHVVASAAAFLNPGQKVQPVLAPRAQ